MSDKDEVNNLMSRRKRLLQLRDELNWSKSKSSRRMSTRSSGSSIIEDSGEELGRSCLGTPMKKPRLADKTKKNLTSTPKQKNRCERKRSSSYSPSNTLMENNEKGDPRSYVSNSLLLKRKIAVTNLNIKRNVSVNRAFQQKRHLPSKLEQFNLSTLKPENHQNVASKTTDKETSSICSIQPFAIVKNKSSSNVHECVDLDLNPNIANNVQGATHLRSLNDNRGLSYEFAVSNRESPNLPSVYASVGMCIESELMHTKPFGIELSEEFNGSTATDPVYGNFEIYEGAASDIALNFSSKSIAITSANTETKPKIIVEESSTDSSAEISKPYDKSWKENENPCATTIQSPSNLNAQEQVPQIPSQDHENNFTMLTNVCDNAFNIANSVVIPKRNISLTEVVGTISPPISPLSKKNDTSVTYICSTAHKDRSPRQSNDVASKISDTESTHFISSPSVLEQINHQEEVATPESDITPIIREINYIVPECFTHKASNSPQKEKETSNVIQPLCDDTKQIRKRRKIKSKFLQSCLEDIEDEVLEDFSGESSDLWSEKDESESTTDERIKDRTKIKKKTKKATNTCCKNNEIPKIKQRKLNKTKLRKARKERGLNYITRIGINKTARELKDNPCKEEKCPNKSYDITYERRKSLFDYYWGLSNEKKRDWIVHCCQAVPIKRKKTKVAESRRSVTYQYFINDGEGRRQVCQQFIIKTLDISQKLILYTLANVTEGLSRTDQRTRHAQPKYDEKTKSFSKMYIESLPVVPSHYNRKNSTKLYLPQEFKNVSNLYRLYRKHCEEKSETYLSEKMFQNVFNEYNYSFHVPKKDKCLLCTRYENNPNERTAEEMIVHKKEKQDTYKRFEFHQKLKDNNTIVASFDLQKVLATPHGESMILYYSRKYAVYNFTVYESKTQNVFCYTWGESDGKRGSNEIGTCIQKYIKDVDDRGVKKLILYCDNCAGQNKNKVVLSILSNFLEQSKNLSVIQINYLLKGHTYMPVDSVHAVIEKEIKRIIVWAPSQWPGFMEIARKRPFPYQVTTLEYQDFINWKKVTETLFTPTTQKNKNLRIKDIRVCTFKKENPTQIKIKYSMAEDSSAFEIELAEKGKVNKHPGKIIKKRRGINTTSKMETRSKQNTEVQSEDFYQEDKSLDPYNLSSLYKDRLPISVAKYNDLKKLCDANTIPKRFHSEYLNLPYNKKVIDTLPETDEEDDDDDIKDDE